MTVRSLCLPTLKTFTILLSVCAWGSSLLDLTWSFTFQTSTLLFGARDSITDNCWFVVWSAVKKTELSYICMSSKCPVKCSKRWNLHFNSESNCICYVYFFHFMKVLRIFIICTDLVTNFNFNQDISTKLWAPLLYFPLRNLLG